MSLSLIKYQIGIALDDEFKTYVDPTPYLDRLLALAGTCDNDTIIEIRDANIRALYKWNMEKSVWQMLN